MGSIAFLKWVASDTPTSWWHDSADPDEIKASLANGAVGITTNPVLIAASLGARPELWRPLLQDIPKGISKAEKAEAILQRITSQIAKMLMPAFEETKGMQGYVCAQVNPNTPWDTEGMIAQAKRITKWAPNIAVKLPATNSGMDAIEECAALGITVTGTVSFTLPQALMIAERYQRGIARAKKVGIRPGRCFSVVMVGRIDDYIRDVALDRKADVQEKDIIQCGNAIMKRAVKIFEERKYDASLMPAGMRGTYHATEIIGTDMTLSIHPKIQAMIEKVQGPFEQKIDVPVDKAPIDRLAQVPEFVRAYEPEGILPEDFISYGVVQKTLAQFVLQGWASIESFDI